jgi:hypothetical protein
MTTQEIVILNSLVTYAAENIPGGLNEQEQAVALIVGQWATQRVPVAPVCPHCGDVAPYGDARHMWINIHLESVLHRWWWRGRSKAKGLVRR